MREVFALLFAALALDLWCEGVDWEQFFQDAWGRGTKGREITWAQVGALARFRADQAQWFPVVSVGSEVSRPQQVSVRIQEELETLTLNASGSLTQRLPGGGAVKLVAQVDPMWLKLVPDTEPEWAPTFSFEGTLPLGQASPMAWARLNYEAEMLDQRVLTRAAWLELVRAAADLDLARLTLAARRAQEALADQRVEARLALQAQGRASQSLVTSEQGEALKARWERLESEAALRLAEGRWTRLCGLELPTIDEAPLLAWAQTRRGPRVAELEIERQRIRNRREDLEIQDQGAALAPVLGWGLSISRPGGHAAVVSVQVGVSMTSDFALVGPPLGQARVSTLARGSLLAEDARTAQVQETSLRERTVRDLQGARESIARHLIVAQGLRSSLQGLARQGEVAMVDALETEAVISELVLLGRRLVWEEVLEVGFR